MSSIATILEILSAAVKLGRQIVQLVSDWRNRHRPAPAGSADPDDA